MTKRIAILAALVAVALTLAGCGFKPPIQWNEAEELLAVLRQNRRKLTVDPSARAFQERLQAEHAASLAKLLPLKARLAATDRLIDQAVYTLYGLTDDEIAIVEGR